VGAGSGLSGDPQELEVSRARLADLAWVRPSHEHDEPFGDTVAFGDTVVSASPAPIGRGNLLRDQRIALLQGVPMFSRCTSPQLAQIASLTTERAVRAGQALAQQGAPGLDFFVVVGGYAIVTRRGIRIATLDPRSFFGELALWDGGRRVTTVVAETDLHLLVLARRDFNCLYRAEPAVVRKVVADLGSRLRMLDELLDPSAALDRNVGPWSL
jgi:CRP/FNR family transcriptional regulator, cyclic AMP receptor protein